MTTAPSKKCPAKTGLPVTEDAELRRWLIACFGCNRVTHGEWTDERGHKSLRLILHFFEDFTPEEAAGADGFIGGWLAAKRIVLNP